MHSVDPCGYGSEGFEEMFCPHCGVNRQSADSYYCTRCGGELPHGKTLARRITPEQSMNMLLVFDLLTVMLGLFSAVALCVTYLWSGGAKWSIYVAVASTLVIAAYQGTSLFIGLNLRRRFKRACTAAARPAVEPQGAQSAPLLDASERASSVGVRTISESTTERLDLQLSRQPERSRRR